MNEQIVEIILAKIDENKADANKRFDSIDEDLKNLWGFRWKIAGMLSVVVALISIVGQVLIAIVKYK